MLELLTELNGGELIGLIAVVGAMLVAAIKVIAGSWQRTRCTEIEASLKHDMLERGMSADEIERVLKASGPSSERDRKKK